MSESVALEVIVSNLRANSNPQVAIAEAMRDITQGDSSESVGLDAHILDVHVYGESPTEDFAVGFELYFEVTQDHLQEEMMNCFAVMDSVESVEKISVV